MKKSRVVDIEWGVAEWEDVKKYAQARGLTPTRLFAEVVEVRRARRSKVPSTGVAKVRGRISISVPLLDRLIKEVFISRNIKTMILEHMSENPLREVGCVSEEKVFSFLPAARSDSLVYSIANSNIKIVATPIESDETWKGVVFDTMVRGSMFAWTKENFNLPTWAKKDNLIRALQVVSSRIDMDGMAHFEVPKRRLEQAKFVVSAKWDKTDQRFSGGFLTNTSTKQRQIWDRGGWYSVMGPGLFNGLKHVRIPMNMVCAAVTIGNGGLGANTP